MTQTSNIHLTENERLMLENLLYNDYEGAVWSHSWDCGPNGTFCNRTSAAGIISSLVKKDLVEVDGHGSESAIWFDYDEVKALLTKVNGASYLNYRPWNADVAGYNAPADVNEFETLTGEGDFI